MVITAEVTDVTLEGAKLLHERLPVLAQLSGARLELVGTTLQIKGRAACRMVDG